MFKCLLRLHRRVSLLEWRNGLLICSLNKLHLNLTGWEGLVLHDNSAAAGQDHDVEVLLFVVGLLVPLPHHISVMGWNQGDLIAERKEDSKVMRIRCQKKPNASGIRITI